MKVFYIFVILLLTSPFIHAQPTAKSDTIKPAKGNVDKQLDKINDRKTALHSDSLGSEPLNSPLIDKSVYNRYGDLIIDDTAYNKKYHIWKPIVEVTSFNICLNLFDRFILNKDYTHTNFSTFQKNLSAGFPWSNKWEWDHDQFRLNFLLHPLCGAMYYNAARSDGYNYYEATAFSLGGAWMWKMFGERAIPERNDLINTSVSGAFLGEIFYRLSSNILDDRTMGSERFFRELAAGLIDPMRGFNRLFDGKSFRVTNREVYQKEPVNISCYTGIHMVNDPSQNIFGKSTNSEIINVQVDYGNPFELRSRKAYDFFKIRVDLDFGRGPKVVDNIIGSGILFGKNFQLGKLAILAGGFQYSDYWDNRLFELMNIGFGGGVITKLPISNTINLYTRIHLAVVPFSGNSTQFGSDTSSFRDYNFGYGYEGGFESTLNFGKYVNASVAYYNYMVQTFVSVKINNINGLMGVNYMNIIKPRITFNLYKFFNIGFEHFIYIDDRHFNNGTAFHAVRTEQKIFLLIYLEDSQRRGDYN